MENLLVGIIVAWAFIYCINRFYAMYKGDDGCGCSSENSAGCGGCISRDSQGECCKEQELNIIHK